MPVPSRPLSPHLQIYRWQISNTLSILHRLSGVVLSAGFFALAGWFVALAATPSCYAALFRLLISVPGQVLLAGWILAFFYHLLNGIRHLFWDAGLGFERRQRHLSGWLVVASTLVLGGATLLLIWRH